MFKWIEKKLKKRRIRKQIWKMTGKIGVEELEYFKIMLESCMPNSKLKLPPANYSKVYSEAPTVPFEAVTDEESTPTYPVPKNGK